MAVLRVVFPAIILVTLFTFINAATVKYRLNDGYEMPAVALGTSLGHLADGTRILSQDKQLSKAVQSAIYVGYRHIDTASLYRTEEEVGDGTVSKINDGTVSREDMFITTKLWNDAHERSAVVEALKESLRKLKMQYVDLYLMHYPMAYTKTGEISSTDYLETWAGLEDAKAMNLTRSIGVSNFNITQMQRLFDNARVKPAVLQIEVNPTITQDELVKFCEDHQIVVMAYSPFGAIFGRKSDAPPPRSDDPLLLDLGLKYNKTSAQIVLRYLLDRKLVPIPRSTNPKRIRENFDIFDFALTEDEVASISSFNKNYRLRTPVKWYDHPQFPFEKKNLTEEEKRTIIEHSRED